MQESPHNLGQVQRWMQAVIMHPDGVGEGMAAAETRRHLDVAPEHVESVLTRSRALTAVERLAVYANAYQARLLECLREEFPVLAHALGQDVFDAFAVDYLVRYPSRSYTLGQLGANFSRYLEETRPAPEEDEEPLSWPDFVIDLAAFEWAVNQVFDGPGHEGQPLLDPDQLALLPGKYLGGARLECVDCLRLLSLRYPVHRYYNAVRQGEEVELPEPEETFLALTRRDYVVRQHELTCPAHELLGALLAGATVEEAILRAARAAGPDLDHLETQLMKWFHDWAAAGFFRAAAVVA